MRQTGLQVALDLRTAGRGRLSPLRQPSPQTQAYAYGPESAESQGQSAGGGGGWVGTFAVCFEQEMTAFLEKWGEMTRKRVENALTCVYEQKRMKRTSKSPITFFSRNEHLGSRGPQPGL